MGETPADITGNDDAISLREWIAKHSDHLDEGIHQLMLDVIAVRNGVTGTSALMGAAESAIRGDLAVLRGELAAMSAKVDEMHAELEAAKPLIERWQHSKIRKLADGIRAGSWPVTP